MADPKNANTPPLDEPAGRGVPTDGRDAGADDEATDTPDKPMRGAVTKQREPLKNPLANRNPGKRQAGASPRPKDEPDV